MSKTIGTEESSRMFPPKYADYFSSMSLLSSKIYEDVRAVEESIKQNVSYAEKCSIIDKRIIYDPFHSSNGPRNRNSKNSYEDNSSDLQSKQDESHVFYDDPILDQDHITALLLTVYPKKSEKYIYDDNNSWLDEYSVPYSCCTEDQAKACSLAGFMKKIKLAELNSKQTLSHKKKKAPTKPPRIHEEEIIPSVKEVNSEESYPEDEQEEEIPNKIHNITKPKPQSQKSIIGVSVMGMSGPPKPSSTTTKEKIENNAKLQEENLPQQVQNHDLIAELQAKLKKNKNANTKPGSGCKQLNKPKAPPPPPPQCTAGVAGKTELLKITEDQGVTKIITSEKNIKKSPKKTAEDEFIVDVSSPCKIATPKTGFDFLDNW